MTLQESPPKAILDACKIPHAVDRPWRFLGPIPAPQPDSPMGIFCQRCEGKDKLPPVIPCAWLTDEVLDPNGKKAKVYVVVAPCSTCRMIYWAVPICIF